MAQSYGDYKERLVMQYGALTEREQRLVGLTAVVFLGFIFVGGLLWLQSSLEKKGNRIEVQKTQLGEMMALEADYLAAKEGAKSDEDRLASNNVSLFTHLQNAAGDLGLRLKDLNEKKSNVKNTNLVQVSVDVNLKEVSIDKLTSFLQNIESGKNKDVVKVTRLKTKTRFDNKELLDVRMTVSTWKLAS